MSEIKRVGLTTLEPQKANEKAIKKCPRTVRICVVLPESTEDKCPEFNYKDDLAAAKKKVKQVKEKEPANQVSNGLDPFGDENDDDVRRIALEMEAKYGTGVTIDKKKRKSRKDDYADIGMGYDESDSFIDNTDGYDEIIPHNVTTVRGGFYINSGALEFKTDDEASSAVLSSSGESEDSSDSDSGEEKNTSNIKRKRILETSDEESNDANRKEDKKPKLEKPTEKPNKISMAQAIKKKLFSTDKIKIKKRRLAEAQKKSKDISKENKTQGRRMSVDLQETDSEKESKKDKHPMKLSSVTDAIDSVIGRIEVHLQTSTIEDKPDESENCSKRENPSPPKLEAVQSLPNSDPNPGSPKTEIPKLPENLPSDILQFIESLKEEASQYKEGGKVKFFSGNVNNLLLALERKCKILGRSSRLKVYEHLAPFVRCRKETLLKRAKNLVLQDEQRRVDKSVMKLKNHIDSLMPRLIANHETECLKVIQRKMEASNNEEQSKQIRAPKRRFPFSEETKKTIKDILAFKKRCFVLDGQSKTSMEDLLLQYVKNDILILWPEGWMSVNVLKKYCSTAAAKTPDPKNLNNNLKHSEKTASNIPAATLSLSQANNLTITPVINLCDKINEVGNNSSASQKLPETTIKPIKEAAKLSSPKELKPTPTDNGVTIVSSTTKTTAPEKSFTKPALSQSGSCSSTKPLTSTVTITSVKSSSDSVIKNGSGATTNSRTTSKTAPINHITSNKPNQTHPTPKPVPNLLNPTIKSKESVAVIPPSKSTQSTNHCQIIDLTDQFSPPPKTSKIGERRRSTLELERDLIGSPTHGDDVLKVMESLKALQKMSSPAKIEATNTAPVSVIAYNKSHSSNSSSSLGNNSLTNTAAKTDFVGTATSLGFQDEFQKQFMSSMNNLKPNSTPNYNKCS